MHTNVCGPIKSKTHELTSSALLHILSVMTHHCHCSLTDTGTGASEKPAGVLCHCKAEGHTITYLILPDTKLGVPTAASSVGFVVVDFAFSLGSFFLWVSYNHLSPVSPSPLTCSVVDLPL